MFESVHLYSVVYLIGSALCAMTVFLGWFRRNSRGGWAFLGLMGACAVWTGAAAVESVVPGQSQKILWSQIEYLGLANISVCLLQFVISYTHQGRVLGLGLRALLWSLPIVSLIVVWTNGWHHLHWSGFSYGPAGEEVLIYHRGPFFWVVIGYTYLLSAVAYGFLMRAYRLSDTAIRRQYGLFMLSCLFPLGTGLLYIAGQELVRGIDVSPLGFSVAGLMIAWNLLRLRLLDLVPIGRATLVEQMPDGMIVFDTQGRLVDINAAAGRILENAGAIKDAEALLRSNAAFTPLYLAEHAARAELSVGDSRVVDARMVPLYGRRGRLEGRLFLLRDITERVTAERERERMITELTQALAQIKTLRDLLPICCSCKKIRNDKGYWQQLESYISENAGVAFSHGLCPECAGSLYPDLSPAHAEPPPDCRA